MQLFENLPALLVSVLTCVVSILGLKKGIAIASLNITGLRSHRDKVQLLIRSLGIHILALNETKLDPNCPKELTSLPGYQQERLDRTSSGGGVSIYVTDSIKYKLRSDVPVDDFETLTTIQLCYPAVLSSCELFATNRLFLSSRMTWVSPAFA